MDVKIEEETTNLVNYWQARDKQLLKDRAIIRLDRLPPKTDEIKWVSNEPKVFYDTSVALISLYPPRFRHPLTINYEPEEKIKMDKAERLDIGILRNLDYRQLRRGQSYWLRELAYWVLSGWYSVFVVVTKGRDGVEFIADCWDPLTVYPEWDSNGLTKCIRTFEVDKRTALAMLSDFSDKGLKFEFKEPQVFDRIKVINYWLDDRGKVYNAIRMGENDIKPLKLEKNLDHIPIFVGAIGVPEKLSDGWQGRWGENIIASNRDMYEYENMMISLEATIMAETAYPNIVSQTRAGAPAVKAEDMKGYGAIIPLKLEDKLSLLKHAATPTEANVLLSWVKRQIQKASFADTVYGGIPNIEISGFALSQYMAAIKYKIGPYLTAMQHIISSIFSELETQYKIGKFPKITLSTTNPVEMKKGLFFVEEFSPKDVPDSRYLEVTIPITSAIDKTQQIIFARQAIQPPQLISRETLWDELLDIQDSEQEYIRILQDQMLEMPVVKQIAMIEQLRERELLYRNQGKFAEADALKKYIMMLEMELGMRQGIPEKPGGVPPDVMPPEMGGASPDQKRSAFGMPPPGLARRAQTPGERAERQGGVVSPTGEQLIT